MWPPVKIWLAHGREYVRELLFSMYTIIFGILGFISTIVDFFIPSNVFQLPSYTTLFICVAGFIICNFILYAGKRQEIKKLQDQLNPQTIIAISVEAGRSFECSVTSTELEIIKNHLGIIEDAENRYRSLQKIIDEGNQIQKEQLTEHRDQIIKAEIESAQKAIEDQKKSPTYPFPKSQIRVFLHVDNKGDHDVLLLSARCDIEQHPKLPLLYSGSEMLDSNNVRTNITTIVSIPANSQMSLSIVTTGFCEGWTLAKFADALKEFLALPNEAVTATIQIDCRDNKENTKQLFIKQKIPLSAIRNSYIRFWSDQKLDQWIRLANTSARSTL